MIENDQRSEYLYLGGGSATRTPSLSFNGSRAVGRSCGNDCRGFVWISDVGVIPIGETDQYSDWTNINGMSDDGQRIVGLDGTGDSSFTWTLEDGLERLILHQSPVILSADGSTIAGLICNGVTCEVALLVEN